MLFRSDMRDVPFENILDGIFNFYTAFGYFEKDEVIIKIADYRKSTNFYSVGRLIKHSYLQKGRKQLFRTISICAGIAGCIFLFLFQGFFRDSKKK